MATTFSERLKARLTELNMSQSDLARDTGITQAGISQYVNGQRLPDLDHILGLSDALDCTTDYLIHGRTYDTSFIENDPDLRAFAEDLLTMSEGDKKSLCDFFDFLNRDQLQEAHAA